MSDIALLVAGTLIAGLLLSDDDDPKASTAAPSDSTVPLQSQPVDPSAPLLQPEVLPQPVSVDESPVSTSPQEMESATSKS